jgi:hypothetical protein
MIKFALACHRRHEFQSWFPDGASFETQARRGLVQCPNCDSKRIAKAPMAPAVLGARRSGSPRTEDKAMPVALLDDKQREIRAALVALRRAIDANTDDVGGKFADTARAIHLGEAPERAIRGRATPAEAQALVEEGVGVLPLPPLPGERN